MTFEPAIHDCALAWRGLQRSKAFAAAAILTLAVGITGATSMFALVEGVLLRPMAVRDQDRLVVVWRELPSTGFTHWPFSTADIDTIQGASRTLERVAGVIYNGAGPMVVYNEGTPSYLRVASATGDFFGVLGVAPVLGRVFTRADDVSGAQRVLVLTHAAWQGRYGGSRSVIGRRVTIGE